MEHLSFEEQIRLTLSGYERAVIEAEESPEEAQRWDAHRCRHVCELLFDDMRPDQQETVKRLTRRLLDVINRYPYTDICWKCHADLSELQNRRCRACVWLICHKCDACRQPGCFRLGNEG